jgi:putative sterol carrier protein
MLLLADPNTELADGFARSVAVKARDAELTRGDLEDCIRLFCMVCNHVDELQFELKDFTQSFQLELGEARFAVTFNRGACAAYAGTIDSPDITMQMDLATARDLVMGKVNSGAAHMDGDITYKGPKNGAIKFQSVFELFLDELDDRARSERGER